MCDNFEYIRFDFRVNTPHLYKLGKVVLGNDGQ
jgi:hypothetical protein